MGIVVPRADARWIKMRQEIEKQWSHPREQEISMKIVHEIGKKYDLPIEKHLAYALDFRVRSILHEIAVEQILKPILRKIPWEEIKTYPEDFLFPNCDRKEMIIDTIRKRIIMLSE